MRAKTVLLTSASMLITTLVSCSVTGPVGIPPTQPSGGLGSATPTIPATVAAQTLTAQPTFSSPAETPVTPSPQPSILHLSAGVALTLSSIQMTSTTSGWGVGTGPSDESQHILHTADGGRTWTDVTPPEPVDPQIAKKASATFRGDRMAWAAYGAADFQAGQSTPVVWRSSDGGQTWTPSAQLDPPSTLEFFSVAQISFLDDQTGWLWAILGAGMNHTYIAIYATRDGGQTWTRLLDPDTGGEMMICSKDGLGFSSQSTGWMAGDCHGVAQYLYLYRTADRGTTWDRVELAAPATVPTLFDPDRYYCGALAPQFSSNKDGALLVTCTDWNANTKQSWLYVTADGGQTWSPRAAPAADGLLQWLDAGHAWLLAGGAIYRTTDGGIAWRTMSRVAWNGQPDFVDQDNGWIVARSDQAVALVHSTNGGKNWEEIKPMTH